MCIRDRLCINYYQCLNNLIILAEKKKTFTCVIRISLKRIQLISANFLFFFNLKFLSTNLNINITVKLTIVNMVWKKFFLILFWTTLPLTIACLILSLNMIWPTILQKTEDIKSPSQNTNNVATSKDEKVSTDEVFNSVTFNSHKYRQTMDCLLYTSCL